MFDHPQDGVAEKQQLWCGRPIDGTAVGQPGQQVKCRSQQFFVYPRGAEVMTHCCGCGGQEDAGLRRTAERQVAPSGAIACERCGGAAFMLYDDGNEVQTKCANAQCGVFAPLGVAK
jgi:hypothetical protein